jgi:methionyl-tRNA formyltransferase
VPQIGQATYAAKITAADRVLDPLCTARELHDRVRALSPHIGARLALAGGSHTIWRTRVLTAGLAPGSLEREGDAVVLGCAEGALEVCELQPPGGRRMPAADWLRGLRGALPAVRSA